MSAILLLVASAMFLIAFAMYNRGVITGQNTPAFAAWGLFSVITAVNCFTYLAWTESWINIAVLFTDFIICVGTTIIILVRSRGRVKIDWEDGAIIMVSITAIVLWQTLDAEIGNWMNQVAYNLAFIPNYRNVWRNPQDEPTRPWLLWTLAFVLNILALLGQDNTHLMDYVSPLICLVCHAVVTVLSLRRKPKL